MLLSLREANRQKSTRPVSGNTRNRRFADKRKPAGSRTVARDDSLPDSNRSASSRSDRPQRRERRSDRLDKIRSEGNRPQRGDRPRDRQADRPREK